VLKNKKFEWTPHVQKAFEAIMKGLISAPILALANFTKVFEVKCDAFGVWIEIVLTQVGSPIACFNEKFNRGRRKFFTYEKRVLCHHQGIRTGIACLVKSSTFILITKHSNLSKGSTNSI